MTRLHEDRERKIIPRWRSFIAAQGLRETESLLPPHLRQPQSDAILSLRRAQWEESGTPSFAADCLATAIVMSRQADVLDVAEALLKSPHNLPPTLRRLATTILAPPNLSTTTLPDEQIGDNHLYAEGRLLKQSLRVSPRNALRWLDLARLYETLGQQVPARRAAYTALGLAPDSRFIVRAVSRMLIHHGEPERAFALLENHPRTKQDPWLLAAHLAVGHIISQVSKQVSTARKLLSRDAYRPFHVSELQCALATLEAETGNAKAARRLLTASLTEPSENAIAQAAWLARNFHLIDVRDELLLAGPSHEARGWRQYVDSNWSESLRSFTYWFADQPFSSRPATAASFVAAVMLENYEASAQISQLGLRANPNDPTLLNNHAFALANLDKALDAHEVLSRIDRSKCSDEENSVAEATAGLVLFRQNQPELGRALYWNAINSFRRLHLERHSSLALYFLTQEERRLRTRHFAEVLNVARRALASAVTPEMRALASKLALI